MKKLSVIPAMVILASLMVFQPLFPAAPNEPAAAAFDQLRTLTGEWEGTANEGGKDMTTATSFRVVSDNSAILDLLGAGTPHEMVTMFHMDGTDLLATHYCAVHNQPRFRYVPSSDPKVVNFEFKDATNLAAPTAPHMVGVKFTLLDPSHHWEDWTFLSNGQTRTTRFDFHRK